MKKVVSFFIIFWIFPVLSKAQCAMCKAVAETSTEAGAGAATGLNEGIVYLMAFPYLMMAAVAFALYRHRKSKQAI